MSQSSDFYRFIFCILAMSFCQSKASSTMFKTGSWDRIDGSIEKDPDGVAFNDMATGLTGLPGPVVATAFKRAGSILATFEQAIPFSSRDGIYR